MSVAATLQARAAVSNARTEAPWLRLLIIGSAVVFLALLILLPLVVVFTEAFKEGWAVYLRAVRDPATLAAVRLTLLVALIVVPVHVVFGLIMAWAVAKFEFRGKSLLISIIDLPFSVSPVVSGLVFVLLFGLQGWFGAWLQAHDIKII